MRPWLAIDGALGAFSAALVAPDGACLRAARGEGRDALERGLAIVAEVLGGTPFAELGGIGAGVGPGGFTGLRIALSYAKGFALAAGLPLAGVSSYDALEPPGVAGPRLTVVHGRAGVACARLRGIGADAVVCGGYAAIADALAPLLPAEGATDAYGDAEGVVAALAERSRVVRHSHRTPEPAAIAVGRLAIARGAAGSAHALRADYGEAHYAERTKGATSA